MTDRQSATRERVASTAQYLLLGGFASVAAGISAQGLTGFARSNMGLRGPWPYLLFFALDGAAGVCAVLLARRAARNDGGLAPRLAVWGLVTASAFFNFTHAPRHPAAPQAYALMPVVAAVLFEFCLREMRIRRTGRADRKLAGLRWLHPAERVRVQMHMAADELVSAEQATRRVRTEQAARRLYQLRMALRDRDRAARPGALAGARARRAQRRAHAALACARFTDPDVAADVLRQVQVLTMTAAMARLDYTRPDDAHAAIGNLITSPAARGPQYGIVPVPVSAPEPAVREPAGTAGRTPAARINGHAAGGVVTSAGEPPAEPADGTPAPALVPAAATDAMRESVGPGDDADDDGDSDARLITAASRIVTDAARDGTRLSQIALAEKLRGQGYSVSNHRLRWLSAVSGLESRQGRPPGQRGSARARVHKAEPAAVTGAARPVPISSPGPAQDTVPDQARTGDPGAGGQDRHPPGGP